MPEAELMSRTPVLPSRGDYYRSRLAPTRIRCKGYDAPLDPATGQGGQYCGTMSPGTYFGPVEECLLTPTYLTVLVNGWWVNVWKMDNRAFPNPSGTNFAHRVNPHEVARWKAQGWFDSFS